MLTTPLPSQVLAQGIRDELQPLVDMYGAECIISLMPLLVNVLEQLDSALADNKDYLTALEETNEENQQLSKEYKKEKQRRKEIEEVGGEILPLSPWISGLLGPL